MSYTATAILGLALRCAPSVAPQTVAAIVQTESHGNPLALNVNGARQPAGQLSTGAAVLTAQRYIAAGYSVDLGLGQINSRNMRKLGLTWDTVFDPCTNIAALGQILSENYRAVAGGRHPQTALRLALSMYNTGSPSRGFRNGYVAKVVGNAGIADGVTADYPEIAPSSLDEADVRSAIDAENATLPQRAKASRPAPPPAWNLFERAAYERETLILTATEEGTTL
ncbi:MAG: lytic transglycosylase domain-containing protein [Candidatus Binataceae bacterium]